jgi:nucleoid DNA-binding protein
MAIKKSAKMKKKAGKPSVSKTIKKASAKAAPAKLPTIKEPLSKSSIIKAIMDATGLSKKEVVAVTECQAQLIEKHVKPGGPGIYVMPGFLKISVVKKPARAARKGVNPFTGEEIMIKARPAYKAVKIKALKKLKEMVA